MTRKEDYDTGFGHVNPGAGALESIRITLELYRTGKSGIQYDKLSAFAQPIIVHYQLDLGSCFTDEVTATNIEEMTLLLDVLETATLLWDYCSLNDDEKALTFKGLQENLLGVHPSPDDLAQFPVLVAAMESQWAQLAEGEPTVDARLPLVDARSGEAFEINAFAENGMLVYGPEKLEVPDAFALFARPLLENDAVYEDPDALDDAMNRAQAYWDYAHLSRVDREGKITQLLAQFVNTDLPADKLLEEIGAMVQRFHELFPERK